jgi:hypothetical protein
MLDWLWSRLWLAVFLATVIPLVAFLLLGAFLIQRSVENADVEAIGRQARILSAIVAGQSRDERAAIQDAVASVGRTMTIAPIDSLDGWLPEQAARDVGRRASPPGASSSQTESSTRPYAGAPRSCY